ncbi:hypothetical protein L596_016657 [Steinernema carpocapsae]|uniref:Uncharacterized protein n=1 Tax=Steinernema carpocapsae TaxID=34508 RepID=A0A4U5NJG3_STECR|nr:hypothetical protein L596_016657 [Steinernema carpocapsae]
MASGRFLLGALLVLLGSSTSAEEVNVAMPETMTASSEPPAATTIANRTSAPFTTVDTATADAAITLEAEPPRQEGISPLRRPPTKRIRVRMNDEEILQFEVAYDNRTCMAQDAVMEILIVNENLKKTNSSYFVINLPFRIVFDCPADRRDGKQVLQRRHSASRARNRRWEVPHSTGHEGRSCVLQGDRRHAADGNLQDQGNVQTAGPRNPRRGDGEGHAGERAGALQRFSGGFEKFRRSEEERRSTRVRWLCEADCVPVHSSILYLPSVRSELEGVPASEEVLGKIQEERRRRGVAVAGQAQPRSRRR